MSTDAKTLLAQASLHVMGTYPLREADSEDRMHGPAWLVSFPRGFEHLHVAVYGNGLCGDDACDAAREYLAKVNPASLTDAEREGEGEETARRVR